MRRVSSLRGWVPVIAALILLATSITVSADTPTFQRLGFTVSELNYFASSPDVAVGGASSDQVWVAYTNKRFGSPFQDIVVRTYDPATKQWAMRGTTSLNYDPSTVPDGADIEVGGPVVNGHATVPYVTWAENLRGLGNKMNIFVSQLGNMNGLEMWTLSGQDRSNGRGVTSLNLNTYQNATTPAVATGATAAGATEMLPWVAWSEQSPIAIKQQIYVARAEKTSGAGSLGGLRWVHVGQHAFFRGEPSLNVDSNQNALAPDIAFGGPNKTQPWVVWQENDNSRAAYSYIFAARAIADASAPGGFRWERVGGCTTNDACALNRDVFRNAEAPSIATGALAGQDPTNAQPWVAWQESDGRYSQIYVSRFDGTRWVKAGDSLNYGRFNNAFTPDITFIGNTPYVTWMETQGNYNLIFVKRLVNATPGQEQWELVSSSQGLNLEMYNFGTKPALVGNGTGPVVVWQESTRSLSQSLIFGVGPR